MRALRNPTSARQRCAQPAAGRRTCVAVCASTVPAPAPGKSGSQQVDETLHFKLVMEALKKEHERHGQGKCMFVSMEGSGRRQTVGWDIQHVGNLSGGDLIHSSRLRMIQTWECDADAQFCREQMNALASCPCLTQ